MTAVAPGGTVGILGGGQLGRMLAMAAARLGLKVHIYAPEGDNPAFDVAHAHTCAPYEDAERLTAFADAVDVITYEFENIPAEAVARLEALRPLKPSRKALETTQDRWTEKSFVAGLGLPVAPFANVESAADAAVAAGITGMPAVLKTRRFGYDGKGQAMVRSGAEVLSAWETLGEVPCILEGFVDFACEVSVIAARNAEGAFAAFDVPLNVHENHILRTSTVPSGLREETQRQAMEMTRRIADALDYEGVLAVEFFVVRSGAEERLLINEIAPRVHNSGHWTEAACAVSQFEQHIRAVCGWPLGDPARHGDCVMTNILGDEVERWRTLAAEPGTVLHLYGKRQARPGRKMGHFTRLSPRT